MATLCLLGSGSVKLNEYEESAAGIIQSFVDRFPVDSKIPDILLQLSQNDSKYFQLSADV